jgi:hypothetical protein
MKKESYVPSGSSSLRGAISDMTQSQGCMAKSARDPAFEAALNAFYGVKRWRSDMQINTNAQAVIEGKMRAAIDAFLRAAWRPIATAPEDEAVLVTRGGMVEIGFRKGDLWRLESLGYDDYRRRGFTHWMSLPKPLALGTEARSGETRQGLDPKDDGPADAVGNAPNIPGGSHGL